jgi:hypothetical protein
MNCPEYYVFNSNYLTVIHWQRADTAREFVSWSEIFNPLRYQVSIGPRGHRIFINPGARAQLIWSNFWFYVSCLCWARGHDWATFRGSHGENYCNRCLKRKGGGI